jgi:RAMP superfamily
MSVLKGKLSFAGKWKIVFYDEVKQKESTLFCQKDIFSNDFQPKQDEESEVDFERDSTPQKNPIKVRSKGQEWKGQEKSVTPDYGRHTPQQNPRFDDRNRRDFQNHSRGNFSQPLKGDFHNPYNFVPAIPRDKVSNELADDSPEGHDKFHEGHFSGKLSVKLTTETPLLLLDTSRLTIEGDHKSYPVKIDSKGKPYLEPTAIKGILRSAYEVITNSRLSVFDKHEDRLAFRREAKSLIPVRVEEKDGSFFAKPLEYQKIDNHVMNHVAKLPRYEKSSRRPDKFRRQFTKTRRICMDKI